MARVSVTDLSERQLRELDWQLAAALSHCSSGQVNDFLWALLGREERIMLVKRYAAILLLQKGCSARSVARSLDMGIGTASRLRSSIRAGEYDQIIGVFEDGTFDIVAIYEGLDKILSLGGILPRYGDSLRSVVSEDRSRYRRRK